MWDIHMTLSKDSCPTWIFRHREDSRTLAWEALRDIHMTMSCGVFSWVDSCGTKTHVPHESLDIEKTHEHSHEKPYETFIWLCHVGQRRMRSFFAKETCFSQKRPVRHCMSHKLRWLCLQTQWDMSLYGTGVPCMTMSTDSVGHGSPVWLSHVGQRQTWLCNYLFDYVFRNSHTCNPVP